MKFKMMNLMGVFLLVVSFSSAFLSGTVANAIPNEEPIVGTCCPGIGTCRIGDYTEDNAYYWKNGPCPPPN